MTKKTEQDEARKKILARRATFVAATLAGVSTACKDPTPPPQPCLSQVYTPEDGAPPEPPPPPPVSDAGAPQPCLRFAAPPAEEDGGRPVPMPCLTPVRPTAPQSADADAGAKPLPQPCLKVKPPNK